jgi:hypothetical protein
LTLVRLLEDRWPVSRERGVVSESMLLCTTRGWLPCRCSLLCLRLPDVSSLIPVNPFFAFPTHSSPCCPVPAAAAYNYHNQQGVGEALAGVNRSTFFITTKTPPCFQGTPLDVCYNQTKEQLAYDLTALGMDHVDLILIHGTNGDFNNKCDQAACDLDYAQWRAYEEFFAAGSAKAIGVSNFCVSCLQCLYSQPLKVKPAVNQIELHVGMGPDPTTQALLAECKANDLVAQVGRRVCVCACVCVCVCVCVCGRARVHARNLCACALRVFRVVPRVFVYLLACMAALLCDTS